MSIQEKRTFVSMFSSALVFFGYTYYTFGIHGEENWAQIHDYLFWARFMLVMIPISIVVRIIVYILFTILNSIATKRMESDVQDERDKLIDLKAFRISSYVFMGGFLMSLIILLWQEELYLMFVGMVTFGFVSDITGELAKFYFYRKGV